MTPEMIFRENQKWVIVKNSAKKLKSDNKTIETKCGDILTVADVIQLKSNKFSILCSHINEKKLTHPAAFGPIVLESIISDKDISLILPVHISDEEEIIKWSNYECCVALETYGYTFYQYKPKETNIPHLLIMNILSWQKSNFGENKNINPWIISSPNKEIIICKEILSNKVKEIAIDFSKSTKHGPLHNPTNKDNIELIESILINNILDNLQIENNLEVSGNNIMLKTRLTFKGKTISESFDCDTISLDE